MSYGIALYNYSGELVISSEGFGLNYVGKATFQGITPNDVSGLDKIAGRVAYRITGCPSAPIPFNTLPLDARVSLQEVIPIGGGVYDFYYHCDLPSFDADGFGTQTNVLEVFVYCRPTAVAGPWGLAVYDAAGTLAYDLSGRQLFPRQMMSWASVAASPVAIAAGLTKPAYFGRHNADRTFNEFPPGVTAYQNQKQYGFCRVTSNPGAVSVQEIPIARDHFPADELLPYDATTDYGGIALVIDAAGLT